MPRYGVTLFYPNLHVGVQPTLARTLTMQTNFTSSFSCIDASQFHRKRRSPPSSAAASFLHDRLACVTF